MIGREVKVESINNKVYGQINGTWTPFIVDTGGCVSVISKRLFDNLQYHKNLHTSEHVLTGLGDSEIQNYGALDVNVTLGNWKTKYRFEVVDHPHTIAILGANFLNYFGAAIDYSSQTLRIGDYNIPLQISGKDRDVMNTQSVVRLIDDIEIRPREGINCIVQAETNLGQTHNILLEPFGNFQADYGVLCPKILGEDDTGLGHFVMTVLNHGTTTVKLPKDRKVGIATAVGTVETDMYLARDDVDRDLPFAHLEKIQLGEDLTDEERTEIKYFLKEYSDVFSRHEYDVGRTDLIPYEIDTGQTRPIKQRVRRVTPGKREALKNKLDNFIAQGFIKPSLSPWASPVVLVPKKNSQGMEEGIRVVCDYRMLNRYVVPSAYPLPEPNKVLEVLQGAKVFSSLDLCNGYHQVELHPRDRPKTAICTEFGLFEWNVLPMGLSTSPSIFQRIMDCILAGLTFESCLSFLDDLLVFGKDIEEHKQRLGVILDKLRQANLKLKPEKCFMFKSEVTYLGHKISKAGIGTDERKIETVKNWKAPTCVKEVRSYIGLCSYYRKFVPNFAHYAAPMHNLLKKDAKFIWTNECQLAFDYLKDKLITAPILTFPDLDKEFILDVDASGVGIGAVLSQQFEEGEKPIAFASRTLTQPETRYTVTRRELLACVEYTQYFRQYLLGKSFLLRTDHGSLRWLHNFKNPEGQVARWVERLSEYQARLEYRPGSKHVNADAMSRAWCHDCQGDPFIAKSKGILKKESSEMHHWVGERSEEQARAIGLSLSYHLRHNKVLPTESTGYIAIQDLMRYTNLVKYRTDDILEVVNRNERFELKEKNGECWVRAIYGHSIHVSALYEEQIFTTIPEDLVHVTTQKAWGQIQTQGIKKLSRMYIHLTRQKDMKETKRGDIVIHLDIPAMQSQGIRIGKGSERVYLSDKDIPVTCIKGVEGESSVDKPMHFIDRQANRACLALAQEEDVHIGVIYRAKRESDQKPPKSLVDGGSKEMRSYWTQWDSLRMYEGVLYRSYPNPKAPHIMLRQILVPLKDRRRVWEALHQDKFGGGHCGIQKSLLKVRDRYYWFGMTVDLEVWGKSCLQCQNVKNTPQHNVAPLHPIPVGFPNERVHMDIVDPKLPTRRNNRWILTIQDAFTKHLEIFPLKNMKTETIVEVLITQYFC